MNKDFDKTSTTPFNMSLATLMRIDVMLRKLNGEDTPIRLTRGGSRLYNIQIVDTLFKELYPFLSDKEREKALSFQEDIKAWFIQDDMPSEAYPNYRKRNYILYVNDKAITPTISPDPININFVLKQYELWLRDMLQIKGLLMAKPDSPEYALEN